MAGLLVFGQAAFALARQTDGKILVGGNFTSFDGVAINRIARLNTDGSVDAGFNPGSGADGEIRDILALPDGGILVAGAFTTYDGAARNGLVRLLPDGSRDPAFADVAGPVMFYNCRTTPVEHAPWPLPTTTPATSPSANCSWT